MNTVVNFEFGLLVTDASANKLGDHCKTECLIPHLNQLTSSGTIQSVQSWATRPVTQCSLPSTRIIANAHSVHNFSMSRTLRVTSGSDPARVANARSTVGRILH